MNFLGVVSEQSSTKSEQTGDRKQEKGKREKGKTADSFARLKGNSSAV